MLAGEAGERVAGWVAQHQQPRVNVSASLDVARRFVADRVTQRSSASPDELAPGEGQVTTAGVQQIAIARDSDGTLHAVSARCTHMGCIVHWNPAETTWDCPCHGSRFALDGTVIEGPAVDDLQPREIPGEQPG
ncbi:MAG: (2Fe-2S)-binding protein [Actinobacteria bacterium]|nr:(2Fe-2S)-binding protein [Actinomycetota bacterium]